MSDKSQSNYRRVTLASRPTGSPTRENFKITEAENRKLRDGEVTVKISHFSLDPYMRGRMDDTPSYAAPVEIGATMEAGAIGAVVETASPDLEIGDWVYGRMGWAESTIISGNLLQKVPIPLEPKSLALGVLGMPGFTGWWGLTQYGKPQPGETILVGAVTGPVGSMVAQLCKLKGLNVIGIAGSEKKCQLAKEMFGVDQCLNHRDFNSAKDLSKAIKDIAPNGIDIYFENVGGKVLEATLPRMNQFGRIPVCGMISWYNEGGLGLSATEGQYSLPRLWSSILVRKLSVQGFIISDHWSHYLDFVNQIEPLVRSNKIKYIEDIVDGIDRAPQAFMGLLQGQNVGKLIVKV